MNLALILAGGQGVRMGVELPKQFLELAGEPIVLRSIGAFERHPGIDRIAVVCGAQWTGRMKYMVEQAGFQKVCLITPGGETRRASCFAGLCALMKQFSPDDVVLIHDAARPLVTQQVITDSIAASRQYAAVTATIPTQDTLLESYNGSVAAAVPDRNRFFAVQTPQTFRLGVIHGAHKRLPPKAEVTDDAGILVGQRVKVHLVPGDKRNLKITSPEDMLLAELYLSSAGGEAEDSR